MGIASVSLMLTGTVQAMSQTELRFRALEERIDSLAPKSDKKKNYGHKGVKSTKDIHTKYGKKGFKLETGNGLFSTNLQWRAQMRYSGIHRSDPVRQRDFTRTAQAVSNFELRRVRMKIGGHGYKKWIKYYFEIDTQPSRSVTSGNDRSRIIDWRIDVQPIDEIGFRVGQWKINYNRERVDSSGRQTFVERSIVNRVFTIDRQVGAMLQGRLFKGSYADLRYYGGIFNGEGRAINNPDDSHMWMGRLQWNFLGRDLKWRQSDVKIHEKPTGSIAFAGATNLGNCTRWSSSGCGALRGYSVGRNGQFRTNQWVEEFAFKWMGLGIQQEYHWKEIDDHDGIETDFDGLYVQASYQPNPIFKSIPAGLEFAFRYAFVNQPDDSDITQLNNRDEYTFAINYFIAGHNNKVTMDVSYLTLDDASSGMFEDDARVRLQWDISF